MRILYVEDNPANLFLVQRVARMGNHEVTNYTEGQPALDHFKEDKPDLVLMDIQLSGTLNGLDVVKALRAAGHKTPIVAVTAYAMSGDREKCIEAGCDGYLSKPLPVGELVELFKRYEPARVAGASAPATAPAAAAPTTPATEPKLDIVANADVKPAPTATPVSVEPAKVETTPVSPTPAAVVPPTPAPEPKTEVPANPYATPVLLKVDSAVVKEASPAVTPAPVEKPAAPAAEAKVESPAPAPETAKPAASANPVEPATSQGTSKESGEKIGAESKPS